MLLLCERMSLLALPAPLEEVLRSAVPTSAWAFARPSMRARSSRCPTSSSRCPAWRSCTACATGSTHTPSSRRTVGPTSA